MSHFLFDKILVNQQIEENMLMKCIKHLRLRRKQDYFLFVISVFMLGSCTPNTSFTLSSTGTATVANDQSDLSTQIAQEELPPPSMATNTPPPTTPVLPVPTASSTPPTIVSSSTPTLISTPTLTSEQKVDNFTRLMTENEGCELPCWWGIVPGETNIETIEARFVPQGLVWWKQWNQLDASRVGSGALVTFGAEGNIVQTIKVQGGREGDTFLQDWERYGLDQVLTRYGIPSQAFVYYPFKADPGPSTYNLYLFYETLGIEIDYAGFSQDFVGKEETQVCPNLRDVIRINLFLYQPSKISNVVETVIPPETIDFIADPEIVYDLIRWEQATDTTLESFYETFSQPNSEACFEFKRYWTSQDE